MDVRRTAVPGLCAVAMIGCMGFSAFYGNLREDAFSYVVASVAATLLFYSCFFYIRTKDIRLRTRDILLVAALFRLLAFPQPPSLSDDAWRYVWDGRLVANGINPYHHFPADSLLSSYHDDLYRLQGYPETNTIYPPVAQLIFASAVALGGPFNADPLVLYYLYKLLLIAADLAAILLLVRMLERLRRSTSGAILYAWHPLVVVELAGQGHTDVFWVLAVGLALYGVLYRRAGSGMPGLAFGVGVRLFPVLLMPVWFRFIEKKKRTVSLLLSLPFLILLYPLFEPEAFQRYFTVAARFTNFYEFNGGFYFVVKGVLDDLKIVPSNTIAGVITTGLMLLCVGAITLWPLHKRTFSALLARILPIITLQILLSAKVHIWYFVLPLYLLALKPDRRFLLPWMWAALIAPMTYLYYAVQPHREHLWVVGLEWGGFLLLWGSAFISGRRAQRETDKNKEGPIYL